MSRHGFDGGGPGAYRPPAPWRWIWRVALLLLPRDFRERYGDDLEAHLAERLEGAGFVGRVRITALAVADAVGGAVGLRWRRLRERMAGRAAKAPPAGTHGAARDLATRMMERNGGGDGFGERIRQDLAFALRAFGRRPGFAAVAVATLALGIGANALVFSVVRGVLLRPLAYDDAERIGILWHEFGDGAQNLPAVHPLDVLDYRDRSRLFEDFTLATGQEVILGGDEAEPTLVDVGLVESGFFDFFGTVPRVGRFPTPEEDVSGATPVAVLSHRVWTSRFGADPEVVGRTVELGGSSVEVVGVAPASFRLQLPAEAFRLRDPEIFVSLRLDPESLPPRNYTGYTGFGRLEEGVSFAEAQAEVEAMAATLREEHPVHASSDLEARIVPLRQDVVKGASGTLYLLFGAVGLVLLVACANVANLLLVRGHARAGELALRGALGAERGRLVRLLLVESLLLATAGAAVGVVLAWGGLEALKTTAGAALPRLDAVQVDGWVLAFAAGLVTLTTLLFGALPAVLSTRRPPGEILRSEAPSTTSRDPRSVKNLLVIGELALCLVLLVGTGLMIRSFANLEQTDPGFQVEGALTFRLTLPPGSFPEAEQRRALRAELLDRLEALPGATSAAAASQLPLTGSGPLQPYAWDEETAAAWESVTADRRNVTPAFFETMGARLVAGESFTGDPETDAGTIVVDDRLAQRAFPDEDPVGQLLQVEPDATPEDERYARIVGVVEHLRLHDLGAPYLTQIFNPLWPGTSYSVVVRTGEDDPAGLAPHVRDLVAELAPGAPVEDVRTLEALADASLAPVRFTLALMAGFGGVALLLSILGIYAVLSYAVAQRTREIGIRLALGHDAGQVRRLVLGQGLRLVALGLALGLVAAAVLTRVASGMLYEVRALDPVTYGVTTLVLAATAMLACWIPARRATRVDPARALKE